MLECKGVFMRCRVNNYVTNDNGVAFSTKFRLLKRKSCLGECCADNDRVRCLAEWMFEYLFEGEVEGCFNLPDNPKHDAIYKVRVKDHGDGDVEFYLDEVVKP